MFTKKLFGSVAATAMAFALSPPALAQETTASIRGNVVAPDGAPVAGATVTITHVPTGTRSVQTTSPSGLFDASGLRIGGPYKVTVSAPTYQRVEVSDLFLQLGEPQRVTIGLESGASDTVVVTASRAISRDLATGGSSSFGARDIAGLPSISRDPKDTARLNPFVTIDASNSEAIVFAGTNSRYNSFTVDSVRQNDEFGLNNNGYPTQRSPVSLDAVQGISVSIAPYDVKYNDFTGGSINVVTKSGTNEFRGSLFGDMTNGDLIGQRRNVLRLFNPTTNTFYASGPTTGFTTVRADPVRTSIDFDETTFGATLGGPILKDRLFFFGSYESFEATRPFQSGPSDLSRAVVTNGVTSNDVRAIELILAAPSGTATTVTSGPTTYTLAGGGYGYTFERDNSILGGPSLEETDEKILAKIDWNITDDHRAAYTYQHTDGNRLVEGNRASSTSLPMLGNYYELSDLLETHNFEVVSNWTDSLTTTLGLNKKEVERGQVPVGGASAIPPASGDDATQFAQFSTTVGGSTVFSGPDRSRHANELDNSTDTYIARAEYELERHKLLAGWEMKVFEARNLFVQDAEGRVDFNSIALLAARTPNRVRYQNAIRDVNGDGRLNERDTEVLWGYEVNSYYLQDTWDISDNLTLQAGVRYDQYASDERPQANPFFQSRYGFTNATNLEGLDVFLPRFGFNYDTDRFIVRGGIGKFSGGSPGVWISNNYSNDGLTIGFVDCGATAQASCSLAESNAIRTAFNGRDLSPTLESILTDGTRIDTRVPGRLFRETLQRANNVNALSPDFSPPTTWKANVEVETNFELFGGEPWRVRLGALHTQVEDALMFVDLRAGLRAQAFAPDGRPIYRTDLQRGQFVDPALGIANTGTDILLRNTQKGNSTVFTIGLNKEFENGFTFDLSYANTESNDVQPGTSSVAFSNYQNYATSDPQGEILATSNYEIRHSAKLRLDWARELFDDNETRITLFGERRSGLPYSFTYVTNNSSMLGDQASFLFAGTGRQLLYVPDFGQAVNTTAAGCTVAAPCVGIVAFANVATLDAMRAYVQGSDLAGYQGRIAPRNGFRSEMVTKFDLRFSQELPAFVPNGAKLKAYMDIENVGNLINTDWGQIEQIEFPSVASLVDASIVGGRYVYNNFRPAQPATSNADGPNRSVWQIKFGAAYSF